MTRQSTAQYNDGKRRRSALRTECKRAYLRIGELIIIDSLIPESLLTMLINNTMVLRQILGIKLTLRYLRPPMELLLLMRMLPPS